MEWYIFILLGLFIFLMVKAVEWENKKKEGMNRAMQQENLQIENFTITKKVDGFSGFYTFAIDEINQKIALVTETAQHIFSFSDIIGVELIENGNIVLQKSTTRTIGGAIVGGVLAGGVGTIVGSLSGNSTVRRVNAVALRIVI